MTSSAIETAEQYLVAYPAHLHVDLPSGAGVLPRHPRRRIPFLMNPVSSTTTPGNGPYCPAGGARRPNWAPNGSASTPIRPNGVSSGGMSTAPPPSLTAFTAASMSATMK